MLETQPIKKKKKLVNNRRKSRELVMKSIYRGILNQFDINQIKKDIKDDPDYLKADEVFYQNLFDGVMSCLLYTSPSPRDGLLSRMPSSA